MDLDLDTRTCNGVRQEKQLSASQRRGYSLCRRKSFAGFVASKRNSSQEEGDSSWCCCAQTFREHSAIHKHVARTHDPEIQRLTQDAYQCLLNQLEEEAETQQLNECEAEPVDISAWIPDTRHISEEQLQKGPGKVLLYYRYCQIEDPHVICTWQRALCEKLHLTGKVRVATEGINGTVGGTNMATDAYIDATRSHPLFKMEKDDFKTSDGGAECFKDLRVGVYKEIVPMGMDPDVVSYQLAGVHLEPEAFHKEVEALLAKADETMTPSSWTAAIFMRVKLASLLSVSPRASLLPDYVDQNLDLFRDKRVLMYCTGGIRCERGSAYLRSKDVCKEVYQLKGGIHKYLEQFPEGFYRGKLFVLMNATPSPPTKTSSQNAGTAALPGTGTSSAPPGSAASWFCPVPAADRTEPPAAPPARPRDRTRARRLVRITKRSVSALKDVPESLRMRSDGDATTGHQGFPPHEC
ncbi:hypothetical protein F7725_010579 [Dissostichus mawsoni]|uniref:Rhodanese domain-containing protein n=1 Tax=Dissostichus mawsoni TaxID=36200 RepID=A0A7J5XPD6_DISMA|nr:hypothetical protein F7725_010579 [Dissostichus mawsoni]